MNTIFGMQIFDSTKSIIENLSFLSGPLIFIVAIIGLRQLKIAQDGIKITEQREAAKLTIQLCDLHVPNLEKSYDKVTSSMRTLNISYRNLEKLNLISLKNISKNILDDVSFKSTLDNLGVATNTEKLYPHFFSFTDTLEIFSVPLIKGIADEELAYHYHFYKFHQYVNLCSPYIYHTKLTKPEQIHVFENLIALYDLWQTRHEKERNN